MKDGKQADSSVKNIESYLGADDPKMKLVREIRIECEEVDKTVTERCDGSAAVYKCAYDGAIARGFKFEEVV